MARPSFKALTQDLQSKATYLTALYNEQTSTSDHARYKDLTRQGGIIRQAELAKQAARQKLQQRIHAMTGVYAYDFKDLI